MREQSKIIEVNGFKGEGGYRAAFQQDPMGDRGRLRWQYQDGAVVLRYDAASGTWGLHNRTITFLEHGVGEKAPETGYSDEQSGVSTSLLPGGWPSSGAYFAMQGIEFRMSPYAKRPDATNDETVSRSGRIRDDMRGIAQDVADAFFGETHVEFWMTPRHARDMLGKSSTFAVDGGLFFKRQIILPPSGHMQNAGAQYTLRVTAGDATIRVPRDKHFPAPVDGDLAVFNLELLVDGYFCNERGVPLIDEADVAEAVQAHMPPPPNSPEPDAPPVGDPPTPTVTAAPSDVTDVVRPTFLRRVALWFCPPNEA